MDFKLTNQIYKYSQLRRVSFELSMWIEKKEQNNLYPEDYRDDLSFGKQLEDLFEVNQIDPNDIEKLKALSEFLNQIAQKPLLLHFSFNQEADPDTLIRLTIWLREHYDPLCLISVGIDPSIIIGCRLRTVNKYFDFSLQTRLKNKKDLLVSKVRALEGIV